MRTVPATAPIPEKRTAHRTMQILSQPVAERYTETAANKAQTLARRVLKYRFMRLVELPNARDQAQPSGTDVDDRTNVWGSSTLGDGNARRLLPVPIRWARCQPP